MCHEAADVVECVKTAAFSLKKWMDAWTWKKAAALSGISQHWPQSLSSLIIFFPRRAAFFSTVLCVCVLLGRKGRHLSLCSLLIIAQQLLKNI